MKMTTSQFAELIVPGHREIINNNYEKLAPIYTQMFNVSDMPYPTVTVPHVGALGLIPKNTEGSVFNRSKITQGDKAEFTAERYDLSYAVTQEMYMDDQYNVMRGYGKDGSAQGLAFSLGATEETIAADVINDGFSVTGYDGKPLFDNDHPLADSATTVDNLLTATIDDANAVKDAVDLLAGQRNEAGLLITANANTLWYSKECRWNALEITKSMLKAHELSNTTNVLPEFKHIMNPYLTANIWGVADDRFTNLEFMWRERPYVNWQEIPGTVDILIYAFFRCVAGYSNWRGLVGSNATT